MDLQEIIKKRAVDITGEEIFFLIKEAIRPEQKPSRRLPSAWQLWDDHEQAYAHEIIEALEITVATLSKWQREKGLHPVEGSGRLAIYNLGDIKRILANRHKRATVKVKGRSHRRKIPTN